MARPRLGPGQARSETLLVRVRPSAREAFRTKVKAKGLTESEALRQALALWMRSN